MQASHQSGQRRRARTVVWTRVSLAIAAIALFCVGTPVTTSMYGTPVSLSFLMNGALAGSVLVALFRPRMAAAVHIGGLLALEFSSAPGFAAPWPIPVTAMISLSTLIGVLAFDAGWRIAATTWAAAIASSALAVACTPHRWDSVSSWSTTIVVGGGVAALVGAAGVALEQRRSIRSELSLAKHDAEVQLARRQAVEERARIARELHDVVAHSMSVVHMQAESAPFRLREMDEDVRGEFDSIASTARSALREMRQLLGTLRGDDDASIAPQPQMSSIPMLVDSTSAAGIPVALAINGETSEIDPVVQLVAYRVVQESLSNVLRHAPGASASVHITAAGSKLAVEITNTSATSLSRHQTSDKGGRGLVGMQERVSGVGGTLEHGALLDGGFRIFAVLPFDLLNPGGAT